MKRLYSNLVLWNNFPSHSNPDSGHWVFILHSGRESLSWNRSTLYAKLGNLWRQTLPESWYVCLCEHLNYRLTGGEIFPLKFLHFTSSFLFLPFLSSSTTGTQQELLGMRMAEFKITAEYCWSEATGLMDVTKEQVVEEKKKTVKRRSKLEVPATPTRRSTRVSEKMKSKPSQNTVRHEEEEEEALMELNWNCWLKISFSTFVLFCSGLGNDFLITWLYSSGCGI